MTTEGILRETSSLGNFDRVSPRRLLTALDAGDRPLGKLPNDLFELIGRGGPHWAGNLNVFLGTRSTEKHVASALRIYPGRLNLAMFVVGSQPDAFMFAFSEDAEAWEATLYDVTSARAPSESTLRPMSRSARPTGSRPLVLT